MILAFTVDRTKNRSRTLKNIIDSEQLDGIPGINKTAAAILAEIGIDMAQFKTAEHICSWAGLSPGNYESAGKSPPYTPWEYLHKANSL